MNNPEDIVQIALSAYDTSRREWAASRSRDDFELELRRLLMQAFSVKKEHTYTINPPNLTGTWTTTQTRAMGVQSNIINKEILHG